jgi:transposase InsO family protein
MDTLRSEDPGMDVSEACEVLGISRSGYYAHRRKPQAKRRSEDAVLGPEVREAFQASRGNYGSPRLVHALRRKGLRLGKARISRLMREQGCQVARKRRFVPRTTVTDKNSPVAPNHLGERPAPSRPDEAWVTDITYLATGEGWLYLAAEMDLHSRRIIGWSTGASLATGLAEHALEQALRARPGASPRELLHHSDRGCQYTSAAFRRWLELRGITQSMSRRGNCYDNAAMESFWATLKAECFRGVVPATRALARAMVFDYIETFYNPVRLHSSLGFQSPVEFEQSLNCN